MLRFRIYLALFFSFFLFSLDATLLSKADIPPIMKQLFEYHIDHKAISPILIERSLKISIRQFDPSYCYLLDTEGSPYINPSKQLLQKAQDDYAQGTYDSYFSLNTTIQGSILRAREWRQEWEKDPQRLIEKSAGLDFSQMPTFDKFASSPEELRERHYTRFLVFLALQMQELSNFPENRAAEIVNLCEKQMARMENAYLGLDEEGHGTPEMLEHQVVLRTLKALANSLDAHTAYYSPEEAYAMKVQLERGMCGIGVVLKEGIDGVLIYDIVKSGPAAKCGQLQVGDIIVEVDGQSVKQASFQRVLELMRGEDGSSMTLGVARKEQQGEVLKVSVTRSKITLEDKRVDIESEPFGDGLVGKIILHSFYESDDGVSSEKDVKEAIAQLKKQGKLHGLILDMRENSGGFLSQAVKVGGLFITSGVVVIAKYSDGKIKYYRNADGERFYDGPLLILVSKNSASAAEIVAQSLQDYGVALVVGDEQTYGKGTIQHQTVTSDNTANFKVTVGKYYTVSGKTTQIDGVKSDILVPTIYNFEKIGEQYADYPIAADQVPAAFQDSLSDLDPHARRFFQHHYTAMIQPKLTLWSAKLTQLKANSKKRIESNRNYQIFINKLQHKEEKEFGYNDLQMEESVNIVKDMILLSK
jgi:carboxyl-terminal processing protease